MTEHHAAASQDAVARANAGWTAFTAITLRVCIITAVFLVALVALLTH